MKGIYHTLGQAWNRIIVWLSRLSPMHFGILAGLLLFIYLFPSLGLTDFNTKGEPREAVVSLSMLQQGNWILPVNNDIDIPYKPMMFHWVGTIVALITGGEVTEATARIPSALALALTCGMTLWFFLRYGGRRFEAVLTALVLAGCFELNRAGTNARVDMMLTGWMVTAFYLLYAWYEKWKIRAGVGVFLRHIPWFAILSMSAAVLTKGPVGAVLPCLAIGIFMLSRGESLCSVLWRLMVIGVLSLLLPACWYYAAWRQGGDAFLNLVMEENFGRMTGTMSYESHSNPWHYNLWITAAGFLPWTLLAIFGLFSLPRRRVSRVNPQSIWGKIKTKWKGSSDADRFSLISLLTIFLFFTLPDSKRSVYLMPAYPFIAWFLSRWFVWLATRGRRRSVLIYGNMISVIGLMVSVLLLVAPILRGELISYTEGSSSGTEALLNSLLHPDAVSMIASLCTLTVTVLWFGWKGREQKPLRALEGSALLTLLLFGYYNYGLQPLLLNVKSLKSEAVYISELMPEESGDIYEYIIEGESPDGNVYHFFELDYYLGDRVKSFNHRHPERGYLVVRPEDSDVKLSRLENEGYRFEQVYHLYRPGRREQLVFYRFKRI